MLIRQHDVTLDVYAIKPLITTIHCKQSEHESNQFNIRLRNGDTDYLIDEVNDKFQILFHKADGNVVESPVTTIVGTSTVSYTCQGNELAFAGKVEIEVRLYREDNIGNVTELLIFPKIVVTCDTIVDVTNAIQSTSEFDTLTALIDEVNSHMFDLAPVDDVVISTESVYSSSRVEERISDVQDAIDACYTEVETDNLLGLKANSADVYTTTATDNLLGGKVDKVTGKGLSTEDYTTTEKSKLAGIAENANNYVHPSTHDATMINEDSTHRFVTDTEKSDWNSKLAGADVVVGGTATKVTYNNKGQVTVGTTLADTDIPNLDAAKITTGVFDIARMPPKAIERLVTVANQTARYALTTATVQLGDTVKETDTGLMYIVKDEANLGNANGYEVYTASTASAVPWSGVTSKPTTVSGYGITDAYTKTEVDNAKVSKAGDTMTGALTLSADPTSNLHASTKQYVDNKQIGAVNLLRNSDWKDGNTGWTLGTGWSRDTVNVMDSTANSLTISRSGLGADSQVSFNPTTNTIAGKQGDVLTFTVWVKTPDYTAIDRPIYLFIQEYNGTTYLADSVAKTVTLTSNNVWQKFTLTHTCANASCTSVRTLFVIYRNGTVYVTKPQLEHGTNASDWDSNSLDRTLRLQNSINSVAGNASSNVSYVDCLDNNVVYVGSGWGTSYGVDTGDTTYKQSLVVGDYIEYIFVGTGIRVRDSQHTSRGMIDVYIDGVSVATAIDRYNASTVFKAIAYQNLNLTYGQHTIKIVINSNKNASSSNYTFALDYFEVINSRVQEDFMQSQSPALISNVKNVQLIDDTDTNIYRVGTWTMGTDVNYQNSTYTNSATTNSILEYSFIGTGIRVYTAMTADSGKFTPYIDDVAKTAVDLYSASPLYKQKTYEITGLTYGKHKIKLALAGSKHASSSGYNVNFDYFEVLNATAIENIGGSNLLKNSAWMKDTTGWVVGTGWSRDTVNIMDSTAQAVSISRTGLGSDSTTYTAIGMNGSPNIPVKLGDTITASVYVKTSDYTAIDSLLPVIRLGERDISYASLATKDVNISLTQNNVWTRFSITHTIATSNCAYVSFMVLLYRNGTLYVTKPQLEKGSYARDWQPAVADIADGTYASAGSMLQTAKVCTLATGNITLSGLQTIDGYTTLAGDRVLLTSQTNGVENGLYYASSGSWVRTNDTLTANTFISIEKGSVFADTLFTLSSDLPITIGVTSLTFTLLGRPLVSSSASAYTAVLRDGSGDILGRVLKSNAPQNTAPLVVSSTTKVDNLNASLLNGFADTALMKMVQGTNMKVYNQLIYNQPNAEYTNSGAVTGTIKITLPQSWSNTMLNISIVGYNYTNTGGYYLTLSGYTEVPSTSWKNASVNSSGALPFTSVRFAHDGTKCCILLGTTTTSWTVPRLYIDKVMVSYSGYTTSWDTGYSVNLITDEPGITTSATPTINAGVPIAVTAAGQMVLNNNITIQSKDTGGTNIDIVRLSSSNISTFGSSSYATTINSTASGFKHYNGSNTLNVVTAVTGTAAPAVTPSFVGQVFVNTTAKKTYTATGTTNSSDWTITSGVTVISENSTATANQATITIGTAGFSTTTDVVRVFINGIKLRPTLAYSVAGTTITLLNNYTLSAGDEIECEIIKNGA
jgi:hypothetical protein